MRYYIFNVEGNFSDSFHKEILIQTNANLEPMFYDFFHEFPKQLTEILDSFPDIIGKYHGVRVSIPDLRHFTVKI